MAPDRPVLNPGAARLGLAMASTEVHRTERTDDVKLKRRRAQAEPTPATAARTDGTPPALLVAEGVRKVYRTGEIEVEALSGLDLTVRQGELVAVMGPSGSGKTTLLNCLSGLDGIDAGRVLLNGRDLFAMSDAARTSHRATSMGFVFQAFNLIPVFTAAENVELPLLLGGIGARQARRRAVEMLERVGLGHRTGHRPNELSGGEQQRVTVARALASSPAIVWADEPTGNLDTATADQVVELLHELNRRDGQTIVLVTHDLAIGESAGRLIRMRDGRLVGDELRQPAWAVR
jgi:putative ABC transport system ATP-binding protein